MYIYLLELIKLIDMMMTFSYFSGEKKILPKKATRNVTLAALLIEEVTRRLAIE